MTIGEKIKQLRIKNDVTQEKLGEYLNITYQSISKWENNLASPDISLIVPIANFFGVTIDELFDRDSSTVQQDIENWDIQTGELSHKGLIDEQLFLWRNAVAKYPNNYHCLQMLAHSLNHTLYRVEWKYCHNKNAKELISICERILEDCTESSPRQTAIQLLTYTYGNGALKDVCDEDKALYYANMAGSLYTCNELLLERAYFTDESKVQREERCQGNRLDFTDILCQSFINGHYNCDKDYICACEAALEIWNVLINDGNYNFYHSRIANIHRKLSYQYGKLKDKNKAIEHLKSALYHSKQFDSRKKGINYYTSIFLDKVYDITENSSKNYTDTDYQITKEFANDSMFDFIRNDKEFIEILA